MGKKGMKWILLIMFFSGATMALAGQNNWFLIANEIEDALHGAMISYEAGKVSDAMEKVADAYFGIFEGDKANMEIAVRRFISLKRVIELEKGFGDLRKAMFAKAPPADIKKQTTNLIETLKNAAKELDRKGVGLSSSQ